MEIRRIFRYVRRCFTSIALKLVSMISVMNSGLSSFVAPINCSKHGWRHLEAMPISRSNTLRLYGDRIILWICFTATLVLRKVPSTTSPQAPTPSFLADMRTSSRLMTQSRGSDWRRSCNAFCTSFKVLVNSKLFLQMITQKIKID